MSRMVQMAGLQALQPRVAIPRALSYSQAPLIAISFSYHIVNGSEQSFPVGNILLPEIRGSAGIMPHSERCKMLRCFFFPLE